MSQQIYEKTVETYFLRQLMDEYHIEKALLVCGKSIEFVPFKEEIRALTQISAIFSDFNPNPTYEEVCAGVEVFEANNCDGILAVGGGSAIDVAKCIKLFAHGDQNQSDLQVPLTDSHIPFIAIPTTAGTGSESTQFAVIYKDGEKQSVSHPCILPNAVILDSNGLLTLPLYQKKCTMLDALSQAIESWWSLKSTDESSSFSRKAIKLIVENYLEYLESAQNSRAARDIMLASNYAGKAINITTTTAAHAMSYQLTKLFYLPHGHAVAICLPGVWRYMQRNIENTHDPRGVGHLKNTMKEIAHAMGCSSVEESIAYFEALLSQLGIKRPEMTKEQLLLLVNSVNEERISNNPILLSDKILYRIYKGEEDNL